jgi:hypothetical protein
MRFTFNVIPFADRGWRSTIRTTISHVSEVAESSSRGVAGCRGRGLGRASVRKRRSCGLPPPPLRLRRMACKRGAARTGFCASRTDSREKTDCEGAPQIPSLVRSPVARRQRFALIRQSALALANRRGQIQHAALRHRGGGWMRPPSGLDWTWAVTAPWGCGQGREVWCRGGWNGTLEVARPDRCGPDSGSRGAGGSGPDLCGPGAVRTAGEEAKGPRLRMDSSPGGCSLPAKTGWGKPACKECTDSKSACTVRLGLKSACKGARRGSEAEGAHATPAPGGSGTDATAGIGQKDELQALGHELRDDSASVAL